MVLERTVVGSASRRRKSNVVLNVGGVMRRRRGVVVVAPPAEEFFPDILGFGSDFKDDGVPRTFMAWMEMTCTCAEWVGSNGLRQIHRCKLHAGPQP